MQWLDQAACRDHDPELFFPVSEVGPSDEQTDRAKAVCRTCPVVLDCLKWAIESAIPDGVWGGLAEAQRRDLIHQKSSRDAAARRRPRRACPDYTVA
jgi:WhiB family transcriptional regulator, redox-sensing transcriptional regulator